MNPKLKQFLTDFFRISAIFLILKLIMALGLNEKPFILSEFLLDKWETQLLFPAALAIIRLFTRRPPAEEEIKP